jgi:Carboxypeptidase regulatory-like domain
MKHMTLVGFVVLSVSAWAASVCAQGFPTSTIVGTVTDSTGGVIPEATVVLDSSDLIGGSRRLVTDSNGGYRFTRLTGGTYTVTASREGFRSERRSAIRLTGEQTLVVDLQLSVASLGVKVNVNAGAPLIDVKSTASPAVLNQDLLDNLPTDRVVSNIMNLTPGVNVAAGLGGTQFSNPIFVDGVNTTDPAGLGPMSAFNYNWISEIQVGAIGANVEYGDFSGIVQTVILKSGGNRISGLGEYRTTLPNWVDSNTSSLPPSTQTGLQSPSLRIVDWHDLSGQIGGPIAKDRVWYFTGIEHDRNNVLPALVAGDDSIDETDRRALGKITAAPKGAVRLDGFYEDDRYRMVHEGLSPTVLVAATTTDTKPNHNWNARGSWVLGDRTTLELRNSGFFGSLNFEPSPPGTRLGPSGHFDVVTFLWSVNASNYQNYGSGRNVLAAVVNRVAESTPAGRHDLKVGAEFEREGQNSLFGYPGGRLYLDMNGLPWHVSLQDEVKSTQSIHRATVYAQDRWSPADRITLQLGLRSTVNRGIVSQGTVLSTSPIDLRLGAAWDVARSHKSVVRTHFGRYHDALLTNDFFFLDTAPQPPQITATVVGPDQFVELSRTTTQNNGSGLDPHISMPYFDQYIVGVERELWPHWVMTAQMIRREYKDLIGYIDTGSIYQPVQRQDPGPDGKLGTPDDGGMLTAYLNTNASSAFCYLTNPAGAYRRYSALQLLVGKQYSRNWQMQTSYVWSSTRGNIDNSARSNSGGPENGCNGIFANPNRAIYADGPTPFDFTHAAKVLASWRTPLGGVNISSVFQYHTGLAWARSASLPNIQATYLVRMEPRGSRRTDALNQLDWRLEKTFDVGSMKRLGVFADVFNVTNQGIPDPSKLFAVEFRSGTAFGQPLNWVAPRTLRAGVRLIF